ncbi:hypothetical protein [Methylocystis heyeri]|uniref:Uncharacterized protein n=1 Tax=Methylocystis heyeri TaxID=391905 RepID=A0A6B8KIF8_9HYPH|nr:hypothetical protein [Methylocystis heyeri]QGM47452.1 hypothetical protein H2LOC_018135 [Methylocystis heyeri]
MRAASLPLLAVACAAILFATPRDLAIASPTTISGTFSVTLAIMSDNATIPLNTPIALSVSIGGSVPQASGNQATSARQTVTKTSTTQNVTISLPFDWTSQGAPPTVATLSVSVTPALNYPASDSLYLTLTVPVPANNGTMAITLPAQL